MISVRVIGLGSGYTLLSGFLLIEKATQPLMPAAPILALQWVIKGLRLVDVSMSVRH